MAARSPPSSKGHLHELQPNPQCSERRLESKLEYLEDKECSASSNQQSQVCGFRELAKELDLVAVDDGHGCTLCLEIQSVQT